MIVVVRMQEGPAMSNPHLSTLDDYSQWIELAREVEPLFGPMVEDPDFRKDLRQAISGGSAFCIRRSTGVMGNHYQAALSYHEKPMRSFGLQYQRIAADRELESPY